MQPSKDAGAGRGTPAAGDEKQGVIGMGELLSAPPKIDWLIDGVLPAKGRAMLHAAEKTGKSFVVLDLALHVATGRKWQGLAVKQGAVYYVASENAETFYERVQAWQKLHGGLTADTPFRLVDRAHNLLQPVELAALLDKLGPAALVIIDTLGRSMDGGDENDNNTLNRVATAMDKIREKTGAAVLLVQHEGDDRRKSGKPRGASAQRGMVQARIRLTREGRPGDDFSDGSEITLTCQAQTRAKKFQPIPLHVKLVKVEGVIVPTIAPQAGKRAPKGKDSPAPRRVPFAQVYAECGGDREAIMARTGQNARAYQKAVERMRDNEQEPLQLAA